eukprot:14014161-Alexandrium_andersonii.AAC.1
MRHHDAAGSTRARGLLFAGSGGIASHRRRLRGHGLAPLARRVARLRRPLGGAHPGAFDADGIPWLRRCLHGGFLLLGA